MRPHAGTAYLKAHWAAAAMVAAAVLYIALVVWLHAREPTGSVVALTSASLSRADADSGDGERMPVTLPSNWRRDCAGCLSAWYEFRLGARPVGRDQMLFLPRAEPVFAAYLDGELLASADADRTGQIRPQGEPRVLWLPARLLDTDPDRLLILLSSAQPGAAILGPLFVGDGGDIIPAYRLRQLLQPGGARFALVLCVIVGLLLAALWAQRRENREYFWLAALALCWALVCTPETLLASIGDGDTGRWLQATALALLSATAAGFALLGADYSERLRFWPIALAGGCASLLALAAVYFSPMPPGLLLAWNGLWLIFLALAQLPIVLRGAVRFTASSWPVVPALVTAGLALRDVAVAAGLVTSIDDRLLPFAAPLYVGGFAWLLLTRFFDHVRMTEAQNVELDRLVQKKTSQIEEQYQTMQKMENERVLSGERERIMHDMHDGVGGQLVSALAMIDRDQAALEPLRVALADALTDMRLMIDSLDAVDEDLNAVLAMFRDRMQPRLSAAGIHLKWQVEDLPRVAGLGPSSVLGILRIMQETITNTLKHGGATRIVVTARERRDPECVEIAITDDGCGFEVGAVAGSGHGLRSMHKRATDHGIDLRIESAPGNGACVRMRFGQG